jgi:ribosomal protein S15P/S13E
MNIDFPPPSKGTYNNAGSSRRLCNYMEHEDMQRMEQGIYTEGFFNLTDDNIYKSQVIKDIDTNIGQLMKTDAKFYAIHVSPSEQELRAMGSTEQEQAEAMKRYIREVVIPEYAKNFNRGLSAEDIKFYGKIHFSRDRSDNELNMHCHLIVSRKDKSNKKKLSPLTNHKNTTKGTVKGGFDRKNLFQQAEQGFDRLFNYDRQLTESFEYYNTMKNGSISDQLNMQEQAIRQTKDNQQNISFGEREKKQTVSVPDLGLGSVLGILTPEPGNGNEEQPLKLPKKKKKPKRGIRR